MEESPMTDLRATRPWWNRRDFLKSSAASFLLRELAQAAIGLLLSTVLGV
jgi:hypothetical protein